ncbi:MAG: DUF2442 domain-containing protein [Balneolales bacterium]
MSTSVNIKAPRAKDLRFSDQKMVILLEDKRELAVPLEWFPKLLRAGDADRNNWRLIGNGIGIHWETLDEDLSVEHLLHDGKPVSKQ